MRRGRRARGFSLVELMVVLAIVAILATVAIASYSAFITRAKRAAAKTALLQDAQWLERNYTTSGCYASIGANCTGAATTLPITIAPQPGDGAQAYALTVAFGTPPNGYTLTAAPANGFTDATCGSFILDSTGLKTISASTDPTATGNCWGR